MTSENIPAVVAGYFTAIGEKDPDAWVACFAEQGTSYEPGAPPRPYRAMWHCDNF
jgi:steroid delta-isomerase